MRIEASHYADNEAAAARETFARPACERERAHFTLEISEAPV
jgi:hypothetical protein